MVKKRQLRKHKLAIKQQKVKMNILPGKPKKTEQEILEPGRRALASLGKSEMNPREVERLNRRLYSGGFSVTITRGKPKDKKEE